MEIRASLLEFVLFIVPWIAAVGWLCSRVLGISPRALAGDRRRDRRLARRRRSARP